MERLETGPRENQVTIEKREIRGSSLQQEWCALLDEVFPVLQGGSFLDDFPVWDESHGARIHRIGAYAYGKLVATASVRLTELKIGAGSVRVGIVGAVATRPDFRGQGLATECVRIVEGWAAAEGAAAFFLWGSEHKLYQRLGYELCGRQVLLPVSAVRRTGRSARGVQFHYGWHRSIFELMRSREGGMALRPQDEHWIAAHKNVVWLRAEVGGKTVAYLAFGRGADLGNMIHEFGGDPTVVRLLFERIRQAVPGAIVLCSPETALRIAEPDKIPGAEYLAMAKIVDPAELIHAAMPESRVTAGLDGDCWKVVVNGTDLGISDSVSLSRLLLGPLPADAALRERASEAGLPFDVWVWGLDAS